MVMADDRPSTPELEPREPTVEDLRDLCRELNQRQARYVVVGGFAIRAAGYSRRTVDVDLIVAADLDNESRVFSALSTLPDNAVRELQPGELQQYNVIRVADEILVDLMRSAAEMLKGEHDFRNFSSCKEDTVRNIQKLDISGEDGFGLVTFDVRANGFLWNMVRKIVRAMEMVGSREKDLEWIEELLNPELNYGAPVAPAEGLILMDVGYDGLEWQVDEYSRERAAKALAAKVQSRMSLAHVARAMQRAMER